MICPRCKTNLVLSNTEGIEIDFCPKCKGVWIHKDQFDRIIQLSKNNRASFYTEDHDDDLNEHHHENHNSHRPYSGNPKRKRGLFSDLFDF